MDSDWDGLDQIHIEDLLLRCIIGIHGDEREKKQDVIINITVFVDLAQASASDEIADTIDYKRIKDHVVAMVEDSAFFLVERLAGRIAELCLEEPRAVAVNVSVHKPGALRFARSVGVEIFRTSLDTHDS